MSTPLGAFVTQLARFFDELVDTIPEEKEIKMAREAINGAKKINPRLLLDLFHAHLYVDFHRAIADGNVDYIVAKGREMVSTKFNEMMPAITIFDKYWPNLSTGTQDAIFKYLRVLCVLCERAQGIPSDM
jgi:hypothetical protein